MRNSSFVNFVDRVAILSGVTAEKVREVLYATFKEISFLVKTGNTVSVPYLGAFKVRNGRVTWYLPKELREIHPNKSYTTASNRRKLPEQVNIDVEIELGKENS